MGDIDLQESPLQLGGKFLKYEVASVIGRGGFAWVYRGHDAFMGRDVAIKILHRKGGVTEDMLRRGQAEAKLLSRLRHPHIVEIYDAGVSEQNLLYIIMELLVGRSLSSALQTLGQLTLSEGLPLFLEIADAFETAHRMGAIHRDIKPENIFVTAKNHAKVLDFGIAKITDGANPQTTNQGLMIGTMKYMSPEQVQGQRVTPSSDIYCLGLVMYEAFSGIHPCFVNTEDASYRALAYKQVVEIPPSLDSIAKGIPRDLSRLVDRCISKRVSERYQSMAELVKALLACWAKVQHAEQNDRSAPVEPPRDLAGLEQLTNRAAQFSPVSMDRRVLAPPPPTPAPTHTLRVQGAIRVATVERPPQRTPSPHQGTPVIAPPVSRSVPARPIRVPTEPAKSRGNALWWSAILVGGVLGSVVFASGTHWYYNYLVSQRQNESSAVVVTPISETAQVTPKAAAAPPQVVSVVVPPIALPSASSVRVAISATVPSTAAPKPKKAKPSSMDAKLKAFQAEQAAEKQWDPDEPIFKNQ